MGWYVSAAADKQSGFQCDGRQYCSQMKSCEEAVFFLRNCPNVKMDGGGDGQKPNGIPCERQWCKNLINSSPPVSGKGN
ncbi:MAG: excalibur calcium-binding domain-containing protein [Sulfuricurvum sp.]|uniref:excalibur calcium-binding domain-containing protein n=1 Tax=Sulfuricurvum sp. IAE1 TaxID=2546102 RepID=UPI0034CE3D05